MCASTFSNKCLQICFRMENLNIRSTSTKAKSLGTIVAVSGAFVVTLYKGPAILSHTSPSNLLHQILLARHSNWILGGLLLAIAYLFNTIWSIYMVKTSPNIYIFHFVRYCNDPSVWANCCMRPSVDVVGAGSYNLWCSSRIVCVK